MRNTIIVTLTASIILFSCRKVEEQRYPIYTDKAMTDYFNYDIGSYWVYYDSVSNSEDSLFVSSNVVTAPYSDGITQEERRLILLVGKNNSEWHININGNNVTLEVSVDKRYVHDRITKGWPFTLGKQDLGGDGSAYNPHLKYECNYYEEYPMNIKYKHVYEVKYSYNLYVDKFALNDSGFIYIEIDGLTTKKYILLRSKISKK